MADIVVSIAYYGTFILFLFQLYGWLNSFAPAQSDWRAGREAVFFLRYAGYSLYVVAVLLLVNLFWANMAWMVFQFTDLRPVLLTQSYDHLIPFSWDGYEVARLAISNLAILLPLSLIAVRGFHIIGLRNRWGDLENDDSGAAPTAIVVLWLAVHLIVQVLRLMGR